MNTNSRIVLGTAVAGLAVVGALAAAGLRHPPTIEAPSDVEAVPAIIAPPLPRPKPATPPEKTRKPAVAAPDPAFCARVRWALANLSEDTLADYVRRSTPAELRTGRKCLERRS